MSDKHQKNINEANKNIDLDKLAADKLAEEFRRQHELKQQAMALELQRNEEFYRDLNLKAKPAWDTVLNQGKDYWSSKLAGYDRWESASSELVNFAINVGHGMNKQLPIIVNRIGSVAKAAGEFIGGKLGMGDANLSPTPIVSYDIDLNDDNTLNIKKLTRNDGANFTYDEVRAFQGAIVSWLQQNDYEPNPEEPGKFYNNNTVLTQAVFRVLRDEDATSFTNFMANLEENKNVNVDNISPRPQ